MFTMQITHVYKVVGNLSLTVDISLPPNFSKEDGILILHFHGGFLVIGEKTTLPPHWLINACRRRNWAYATASYRLLPEASGLDILSDALDVTKWIYGNIATNLILAGSSAGGYLAFATAALQQSPPILSVLSIYGMLDLTRPRYLQPGRGIRISVENVAEELQSIEAAMETGDPIDGYAFPTDPSADKRFRWISSLHEGARMPDTLTRIPGLSSRLSALGVDVIPESHRALFPVTFGITANFPPIALIHGDQDDLVESEQSVLASEKMKHYGVSVILELVEGQGHGFDAKEPLDIDTDGTKETGFHPSLRCVIAFLEETVASGKGTKS